MTDANQTTPGNGNEGSGRIEATDEHLGAQRFTSPRRSGLGHVEMSQGRSSGAHINVSGSAFDDRDPEIELEISIAGNRATVNLDVMTALELSDDIEAIACEVKGAEL